jgi:prevent-host-death family protein
MIHTGDTTIVGITEARSKLPELLNAKTGKVIITKNGQPVGVFLSYAVYQAERGLEDLEDEYYGKIAQKRVESGEEKISEKEMDEWIASLPV